MKLIDTDHPFFKPLWIRLVVIAVSSGWAMFEFLLGNWFWGALFAAFAALSVHGFFIAPRQKRPDHRPPG